MLTLVLHGPGVLAHIQCLLLDCGILVLQEGLHGLGTAGPALDQVPHVLQTGANLGFYTGGDGGEFCMGRENKLDHPPPNTQK